jgi:NTP pyrophosphatase (non-canonical NTP hydrolase)
MTDGESAPEGQTDAQVSEHFNGLTPAEAERLSLLAEECAEVIQAVTKIQRHGYESRNPFTARSNRDPTNREALEAELGHVAHAIERMVEARDLTGVGIRGAQKSKADRIGQWLHHQSGTKP